MFVAIPLWVKVIVVILLLVGLGLALRKLRDTFAPKVKDPPPISEAARQAVDRAIQLVDQIRSEKRMASTVECNELKTLLDTMQAGGVSQITLVPIYASYTKLCSG